MWRFVFLFCAAAAVLAATTAVSPAEMVYYVEDFENDGVAGFDPTYFQHELSAEPPKWRFVGTPGAFNLVLAGATDTISFNCPTSAIVTYSAVSLSSGTPISSYTSVRFIGSDATWETGPDQYGMTFVEISCNEIGVLERVELQSWQAGFRSVTIGVIPEPSSMALLALLASAAATLRVHIRPRHSR